MRRRRFRKILPRCAAVVAAGWALSCGRPPAPEPLPATTASPRAPLVPVTGPSSPGPAASTSPATAELAARWAAAVDSPGRPADDRERDADRRPARVLAFFGIRPGMSVVDLMAGKGYYTEILARGVGSGGKVFCQNNAFVVERFADGPLRERLSRPGLDHVVRLDQELDGLELEPASLDAALMVLFYHDTVWQKVDRAEMNRRIFAALRPGGVFGVVDHHAQAGSGTRDVSTLHRIDAALLRREVEQAGFAFAGESDLLAHPEDDRTRNVFDAGLRGKTDRFVYRFEKP